MFAFIRASSYAAAAYFLSWIVLGKFILLALFLAVMLEAFENKYQVGRAGWGPPGAVFCSSIMVGSRKQRPPPPRTAR